MLSQAIESLVLRTVEQHAPCQTVALGLRHLGYVDTYFAVRHTIGLEGLAVLSLLEQSFAVLVQELHPARLRIDQGFHALCLDLYHVAVLANLELRLGRLLHDNQALLLGKLCLRGSLHTDNVVVYHLQTHHLGTVCLHLLDRNCHKLAIHCVVCCHQGNSRHGKHSRHEHS